MKDLEQPLVSQKKADRKALLWTVTGCVGICFWASSFAASRVLSEVVGTFMSTFVAFTTGGIVANFVMMGMGTFKQQLNTTPRYWLMCGVPFALYPFFLFLGFSQADSNTEIVLLTVINYLWPQLMSILGIIMLGQRWKWSLPPAVACALSCILMINFKTGMTIGSLLESFVDIWPAVLSCTAAALCWAFYSISAKKFSKLGYSSAVPLMTIGGGLACGAGKLITGEESKVPFLEAMQDPHFVLALLYFIAVPVVFCRFTWDAACRFGNITTLTAFAYLNPFLATLINLFVLQVPPSLPCICGSLGLVMCSAVASVSVKDKE